MACSVPRCEATQGKGAVSAEHTGLCRSQISVRQKPFRYPNATKAGAIFSHAFRLVNSGPRTEDAEFNPLKSKPAFWR